MNENNDMLAILDFLDYPVALLFDDGNYYQNPAAENAARSAGCLQIKRFIPRELLGCGKNTLVSNIVVGNFVYNITSLQISRGQLYIFRLETPENNVALFNVGTTLRSSFNSLFSYLTLFRSRIEVPSDQKTRDFTAAIDQNVARIIKTISNIADLENLTNGSSVSSIKNIDINDFCHKFVLTANDALSSLDVSIDFVSNLPDKGPFIAACDKDKLERALYNLISNSVKSLENKKKITLTVSASISQIAFTISDSGSAIPPEYLSTLFNRYSSKDMMTTMNTGAGFGLAIVHAIAKMHNGSVLIESSPQHGTTATIFIENKAVPEHLHSPAFGESSPFFPRVLIELSDVLPRKVFYR